jgi:opacity protein-like surface antigen
MKTLLTGLVIVWSLGTAAAAACVDMTASNVFVLTRNDPLFVVQNTILDDGTVIEDRQMVRNGTTSTVRTEYWNGVVAVDRQAPDSRIQLIANDQVKSLDLSRANLSYRFDVVLRVDGSAVEQGEMTVQTREATSVNIDGCSYPVMVVRTSLALPGRAPINNEALLSRDAGMIIANVRMTPDWEPSTGVFFDTLVADGS